MLYKPAKFVFVKIFLFILSHRHEIAFSVVKHGGASLREKKLLTCASSELSPISIFKRLLRGRNEENEPFLSETQLLF